MRQGRRACLLDFFWSVCQLHPACSLPDSKLLSGNRATADNDLRKFSIRGDKRSLKRSVLDAVVLTAVIHLADFPERAANGKEFPGPFVSLVMREKVTIGPLLFR